jgi:type III pantothenate kinase
MILVIDLGNTRGKMGCYTDQSKLDNPIGYGSYAHVECFHEIEKRIAEYPIQAIAILASGEIPFDLKAIQKSIPIWVMEPGTKTPLVNEYGTPATLGRDRIAACVGASLHFPKGEKLVINCGTCITIDLLGSGNVFKGGNISPGLNMRLRAMHGQTAKLPLVAKEGELVYLMGNSTETAIRNGVVFGTIFELESYISVMESQYPNLSVILSGGDGPFLLEYLKKRWIFADPFLVLRGLYEIYTFNTFPSSL